MDATYTHQTNINVVKGNNDNVMMIKLLVYLVPLVYQIFSGWYPTKNVMDKT